MIISKTPFRISFVGGGSDLRDFYRQSEGAVLSTSINKYMYISSRVCPDQDKMVFKYGETDMEVPVSVRDIKHPIIKTVLNEFEMKGGLEITSSADILPGSGLGSSSAFTVGLLHNFNAITGKIVSKEELASQACKIEIEKMNSPIGKQDQYSCAYGGLNIIKFHHDDRVSIKPVVIENEVLKKLEHNLFLYYIGNTRKASSILQEQKKNMNNRQKIKIMKRMVSLVYDLEKVLTKPDLQLFGEIIHENWLLKKNLATAISNSTIDEVYKKAIKAGASGGKLLGAGHGGFMLFYCPEENHMNLKKEMALLQSVPFHFEKNGSQLIYNLHNSSITKIPDIPHPHKKIIWGKRMWRIA